MARFIILPVCYKDLLLGLIDLDFKYFLMSSVISNFFFRLEMLIVFSNVEDLNIE